MGAAVALAVAVTGCSSAATPDPFPHTTANVALCRDVQSKGAAQGSVDYADGDQGPLSATWRHVSRQLAYAAQDAYQDPANPGGNTSLASFVDGMKELRSACKIVMLPATDPARSA